MQMRRGISASRTGTHPGEDLISEPTHGGQTKALTSSLRGGDVFANGCEKAVEHALGLFRREKDLPVTRDFSSALFRESIGWRPKRLPLKTCYAIIKDRSCHGSETNISLVLDATGKIPLTFSSYEEARRWIRLTTSREEGNERGRVIHTITEVGSKGFNDASRCIWGRQT